MLHSSRAAAGLGCSSCRGAQRSGAVCAPVRPAQAHRGVAVRDAKSGKQQSVDDVLAAANALLDNLSSGMPAGSAVSLQDSIDELQSMGYVCDESGCVLVLPGSQDGAEGGSNPFSGLLSGSNWSLGMLEEIPEPEEGEEQTAFTAVIAGPAWSIPLKPSELSSVLTMLMQLRMMVADLDAQGQWTGAAGERPASRVKRAASHIELKAEHAAASPGFTISFTFKSSSRSVSTSWPADVTAAVITAVDKAMGTTGPDSTGRLERVPSAAAVSA